MTKNPQAPAAPAPGYPPVPINIEDEMRTAYINYSMSVIVGRALPDARDGLKPVHRRVLYAMHELGLAHNRPPKKSARVVGDVIGKYHPHGDVAVYDTIVRMVQDFSLRYPLVDGQGNFGSVDGDAPAAMRYTEVRLAKIAQEMLAEIEQETVDFGPNYDDSLTEPRLLPARIPNLLVNGSSGIAVGMATNIPPHNLREVVDALLLLLDRPGSTTADLMTVLPGPDFPTAGFIHGVDEIRKAYETGRGIVQMRARVEIETDKHDRETIVVTELPYQVNKAALLEKIAELVRDKKITGIGDLRDESDREGMRVVIEVKRGEAASFILNQLYKHTALQSTFGVILLALVDNQPRLLTLKDLLGVFLRHRHEIVVRRTAFALRKAEERAHVLEGFRIALDNLDAVIALIRGAADPETARAGLVERFGLSQIQAQAILDLKLQRLTGLEREKILEERRAVLSQIEGYKAILGSDEKVRGIIRDELKEIQETYGDDRRTVIVPETTTLGVEDLIAPEEMVITISNSGYAKRNPLDLYRAQRRGGKGKIGMETREEDFVRHLFTASTHDYILFFTDTGRVHWLKVHQLPEVGRAAKGKALVNLLQIRPEERITAVLSVAEFSANRFVVMATRGGVIKKTPLAAFAHPRAGGIIAVSLDAGDQLIQAGLTDGTQDVFLATRDGMAIRFPEGQVRDTGRTARGVTGIRLREGDVVVGMELVTDTSSILTITDLGFGKRSDLSAYRRQSRGGIGIITLKTTEKNGSVIGIVQVAEDDQIIMTTGAGKVLRVKVREISVIGRITQGMRILDLEGEDRVTSVARLAERDEGEGDATEPAETEGAGPKDSGLLRSGTAPDEGGAASSGEMSE
jgi:DNA gyrase subunit A